MNSQFVTGGSMAIFNKQFFSSKPYRFFEIFFAAVMTFPWQKPTVFHCKLFYCLAGKASCKLTKAYPQVTAAPKLAG